MENTLQQITMLRKALELLDACELATDAIYNLSQAFYGNYHADYETLNDAVWTARRSLTNELDQLEALAVTAPLT